MEKREEELQRAEFLARRRAQTLGERPYDASPLQLHPDGRVTPLSSSSSRSISQHNDTSSSTGSHGSQPFGRTYNLNRPTHSQVSQGVSGRIGGDGVGDDRLPYQYPPTLRTRTRRSATIPLEAPNSIWRPRPRQTLSSVDEDFNSSCSNYFSEDDDDEDDNRTIVDYHQKYVKYDQDDDNYTYIDHGYDQDQDQSYSPPFPLSGTSSQTKTAKKKTD
ncbi:hypothetical protein SMACR_05187 [Sordaria macrospora]|uniref:WGS project CABT00000000 data, contig 2.8 n=2 Tax=Sordaria macrospora TaxID=5147 RepID=F7VV49_SORMK|nr:uncharacterized protein SMAC_05187 [Sordaria macrospora k-hell]KAA8632419.1 hypothetical protein SMACR_05187 [Sordaria macrospora]KAH7628788.1 hypothetical protein B0T09DRAFT_167845 [Sordaria sp. MPI-SDFR-AT-0083]WPJ57305.1 hypothetical protein SMAC4_05187 [Sordaria macrospora]CCC09396.1 unnamed protein product [Sordaria macrospora k-hell]